jgi:hypothetical protein|tara:strand:+ start:122 stop:676 length:555 start_codon:yes stop_codon:yes gene_type:complete
MANINDVVKGLAQAAANAYDGALDENGDPLELGLKREKGRGIYDKAALDGFKVKFAADQMVISYQSEMNMKDMHPPNKLVNEVEARFSDILKYLKKEYKKLTKDSVSLSPIDEVNVDAQSISRVRTWIQAQKAYKIGGVEGVDPIGQGSDKDRLEDNFKKFLELSTDKRPPNDKSKKNPDTPEA